LGSAATKPKTKPETMIVDSSHVDVPVAASAMRVHVHAPAGASATRRFPGLVLYSEIYQQTEPIRRAAVRLAGHGYVVAVPEVFHEHEPPGTVLPYDPVGTDTGNRYKYDTSLRSFDAGVRAVTALLRDDARVTRRLGAIGWCLGGHLAFRAAFRPEVLAAACFYPTDIHDDTLGLGKASDSKARAGEIRGEVALIFGRQDPHVPPEGRRAIYDALTASNVSFSWHEFNAIHAFMRDEGPRYDPALTTLGFSLALEMFDRVLKATEGE